MDPALHSLAPGARPARSQGLPTLLALVFVLAALAAPPLAAADGQERSTSPVTKAPATVETDVSGVRAQPRVETIVVRRPPPDPERPPGERPVERIDLSLREADLVEVLRTFARLGGFDLVVDPAVEGEVTVELVDVEWPLALMVILRSQGLAAEVEGNVVAIGRLPVASR